MEENRTLASELLHEVKLSAQRWFKIAVLELCMILAIIGAFLWYLTLPAEEYSIEQEATDRSFNVVNGGNWNGSEAENNLQEKGNEKAQEEGVMKEEPVDAQF